MEYKEPVLGRQLERIWTELVQWRERSAPTTRCIHNVQIIVGTFWPHCQHRISTF